VFSLKVNYENYVINISDCVLEKFYVLISKSEVTMFNIKGYNNNFNVRDK